MKGSTNTLINTTKTTTAINFTKERRSSLIGAIFLMATSAIGPGFITQTATFTASMGAAFAFGILASVLMDFVIQMNIWRVVTLTNMRASGSDEKARLIPPVQFSLEEALEYIKGDEYVEVTPKSMRMRKVILDETERKRANKN